MKLTNVATAPANLQTTREDFDRFADRFFNVPFFGNAPLFGGTPRVFETLWAPNLDFSENEKEYIVRLEAPGVPKDDLYLNLDGQTLTISGERVFSNEEKTEEYFWREREQGRFVRSVQLPMMVDAAKVDATYVGGIMTIRLPKKEAAAKTRIPIK
jgi:HSP20 family molecular chaperone IbpA